MPKTNKIPDRWEDYGPFGDVIKGTNILPLKVPLNKRLSSRLPEKDRFTPMDLFEKLDHLNYKLGLLIDLTNTSRYYNPDVFIDRDVQYVKIFTQGHVVPSAEVMDRFTSAVLSFKEYNKNNDLIIGVHCTHGVNRTGYLICRYLIEHEGYKPKDALKAFKEARGYPVERENYVEDLLQLCEDRKERGQYRGSHSGHSQQKRKNDYNRTRNDHNHDGGIRRGNHQHFHDPYYWNGAGQQVAYRNTFQRQPQWRGPFRNREGSMRRDGGVDYTEGWNAWQGHGAYRGWDGGQWIDYNSPDWGYHDAQYNQSYHNARTPQHDWNRGPNKQVNPRGPRRNMYNSPY